jgi:hypothetical protein
VAQIVAVATELLLASKVEATLKAAGHDVTLSPSLAQAPLDGTNLIVADLDTEDPKALVDLGIPILGYYAHTNAETRKASEAAGIDLVVPRSRLARELPELVKKLLARG